MFPITTSNNSYTYQTNALGQLTCYWSRVCEEQRALLTVMRTVAVIYTQSPVQTNDGSDDSDSDDGDDSDSDDGDDSDSDDGDDSDNDDSDGDNGDDQ